MVKNKIRKTLEGMIPYARLDAMKFGLAGGIIFAICVFITTLLAMNNYCVTCGIILRDIYGFLGYDLSFVGSLFGAIYGFVDGFIFTGLFAWIYNKLL